MAIRRITSAGIFEEKIGYCRAVVAGDWVHVAGTTAQGENIPSGALAQCQNALTAIESALTEAGAGFADVVRVTYIMPDERLFLELWPLLSATFGPNPPVATFLKCDLIDPKYLIEIEVTAYIGSD
ncbi:MAG: Rid family hydrolase [Pseudomonadota bacterium]